jgi:hypothetical protein
MKKMNRTLRNFLQGMGSVLELYPPSRTSDIQLPPRPQFKRISAEEALRGDMEKIGGDFRKVIASLPECANVQGR